MPAFDYLAIDNGRDKRGVIEADTARHARQLLREKDLLPVEITEVVNTSATNTPLLSKNISFGGKRMRAVDLSLFTRQLATLLRSSIPLDEALGAIAEQTERASVKSIIMGVRSKVLEGYTLANALNEFPKAFPDIYRSTVDAGEHAGQLDGVLERLADYTENRQVLKQKISNALIYPVILVIACLGIVIIMMNFVVPKIVGIYQDGNFELPTLTKVVISISDFTTQYLWLIAFVVVGGLLFFKYLLKTREFRFKWHQFLLKIPIVKYLQRSINTARFTRTMSIMASSGVPILESLRLSGEVVTNLPMQDAINEAAIRVREGASIGNSLASSKLFPPMAMHLIRSGEASGELEDMLERAATNQERELENNISSSLAVLQPVMILVMAGIVVTIVLAVLMPIFNLNDFSGI